MKIYLIQHAEPRPKEEDPNRSLSGKGLREAGTVAAYAATHLNIEVNCIYHSGKLRAMQTADVLANHLHPPGGIRQTDGLDPMDDPLIWMSRIKHSTEDIMVVGHLPQLSELAAILLCGDRNNKVVQFRHACILNMLKDKDGKWVAGWMVTPSILSLPKP